MSAQIPQQINKEKSLVCVLFGFWIFFSFRLLVRLAVLVFVAVFWLTPCFSLGAVLGWCQALSRRARDPINLCNLFQRLILVKSFLLLIKKTNKEKSSNSTVAGTEFRPMEKGLKNCGLNLWIGALVGLVTLVGS